MAAAVAVVAGVVAWPSTPIGLLGEEEEFKAVPVVLLPPLALAALLLEV